MIGAAIFLIFFVLFLAITLGMPLTLPPGNMIHDILGIPMVDTLVLGIPTWQLINGIINGVVYGVIIWFVFSLVKPMLGIGKPKTVEHTVTLQVQDTERDLSPPDAHEDVTVTVDDEDVTATVDDEDVTLELDADEDEPSA
jgi:hypothetical protein